MEEIIITEEKKDSFIVSSDPGLIQIDRVHRYLSEDSYWCVGIPKEFVAKAVKNSLCFGVYEVIGDTLIQVGFARVVTDFATFAWICDVYIEKDYRKKGLSKWMMAFLIKHPQLKQLRRICLATLGAHTLYEKYGFTITKTPTSWMEIKDNDIYKKMKEK